MSLKRVISEEEIRSRIRTLSEEIALAHGDSKPLLLGVLKGSLHFLSDLSRTLPFPHDIDFLKVNTYREGNRATPTLEVEHFSCLDLANRNVLIVDEILDRGHTARAIERFIRQNEIESFTWVFLLVKEGARKRADLDPEYVGFEIGEEWVVGYGMDLDEKYRELPEIFELDAEKENS